MKLPTENEEYYRPMDGVLPEDHIYSPVGTINSKYLAISHSVCLTAPPHEEIYIELRHRNRLCGSCFRNYMPPDYVKLETNHIVHHRENYNPYKKLYCSRCFKQVLWENGSAGRCPDCIEEVLNTELSRFIAREKVVIRRY